MSSHDTIIHDTALHSTALHWTTGHDTEELLGVNPKPRRWAREKTGAWHVLPRGCDVKVYYFRRVRVRSGNGGRAQAKGFRSFRSGSGSNSRASKTTEARIAASPPRSGYCASRLSICMSVCLLVLKRSSKKGNLLGKAGALPRGGFHHVPTI